MRLRELHGEIDEAASWNDPARLEALQAERDALVHELTAAFGLRAVPAGWCPSPSGRESTSHVRSARRYATSASRRRTSGRGWMPLPGRAPPAATTPDKRQRPHRQGCRL